jgi:alpha-galactosidase
MPWRMVIIVLLALLAASGSLFQPGSWQIMPAHAESNGQATTPFKGWSTWSYIGKNPTAANVYAQAQLLVSSGLAKAGYNYVLLDDWYYLDPRTTVDTNGWLLGDGYE